MRKSLNAHMTPGRIAVAASALFVAASVAFAFAARYPYTDDSVYHYLIARYAPVHPDLFVSFWGKPAFTLLHALPAQAGYIGSRLFSIALTLFAAYLTALAARAAGYGMGAVKTVGGKARRAGIWPLAMPLCLFSPQLFTLSFNPHSETIYAVILAGALLAYFRRRFYAASVLISLGVMARPEGFFLLLVFSGAWFFHWIVRRPVDVRRFLIACALLSVGPAVWTLAANVLGGRFDLLWRYHANPYPVSTPPSYGGGDPFHFVLLSPIILGLFLLPFFAVGAVVEMRRRRCLPLAVAAAFWALQTFLFTSRLFASGGYPRFFAAIAPATTLVTLAGLSAVMERFSRGGSGEKRRGAFAAATLLLSAVFAGACYAATTLFPFSLDAKYEAIEAVNVELRRHIAAHGPPPVLVSEDAYVYLLNDMDAFDWNRRGAMSRDYLDAAPAGTVVLWRRGPFSPEPGVEEGYFLRNGYSLLARAEAGEHSVRLYVRRAAFGCFYKRNVRESDPFRRPPSPV